jgi:hypothetical protein
MEATVETDSKDSTEVTEELEAMVKAVNHTRARDLEATVAMEATAVLEGTVVMAEMAAMAVIY